MYARSFFTAWSRVWLRDDAPDRDSVTAGDQEALKLAGGLVELNTGGTSPPVGHLAPGLNRIAVLVIFGGPPLVAVAVDPRVLVLDLDGEQPSGAEQQVIDLPAAVAVSVEQGPSVIERQAEPVGDQQFPSRPGGPALLFSRRLTRRQADDGTCRCARRTAKTPRSHAVQRCAAQASSRAARA